MKPWWIAFLVASTWVHGARADDASDLAERAIKAQYGEVARMGKGSKMLSTSSGKIVGPIGEIPAVREVAAEWPNRCRVGFLMTIQDERKGVELALDGDKGWRRGTGQPSEALEGSGRDEVAGDLHVHALATLIPLKSETVTLATAPEAKVNGKPAKALKVSQPGKPDVVLYFDAESSRLVRASYRGSESGQKVVKDFIFGDHREVQGVLVAHKVTEYFDRVKKSEWKIEEIKFVDALPKGAFDRP